MIENNIISKIYTYKNPYEIDKMNIWNDIKAYPHICVSQTLVEGLKEYYGRENFSVLCTVDTLLKKVYEKWHNSAENNIAQSTKISNVLDRWQEEMSYNKGLINSFKHNKKDVIKSIRYIIESDVNIKEVEDSNILTDEQRLLLNLYNEIRDKEEFKVLEIKKSKTELKTYIEDCYTSILLDELKKYISIEDRLYSEDINKIIEEVDFEISELKDIIACCRDRKEQKEYYDRQCKKYKTIKHIKEQFDIFNENKLLGMAKTNKVFLHGIHQFSPLLLRLISLLNKAGIEVIAIFNYMNEYSEIYKTWNFVYDWTNVNFIEEGNKYTDQRDIGEGYGKVFQDKLSAINKKYTEKYYCFDNLTSFSDYVGKKYEAAVEKYEKTFSKDEKKVNEKLIKIALMNEQFYAINGEEINELLKLYFPEQFSDRHFLTYPVGQFIFSLYNMWDDYENKIVIKEEYMEEALSFNIWQRMNMPTPVAMFNNLKYYFRKVTTLDGYLETFEKLMKVSTEGKDENRKRLSFFIYNKEELEYFREILKIIKKVSNGIFTGEKDTIKNNFTKLMNNINKLVDNPSVDNKVSEEELQMVKDIQKRLYMIDENDQQEETYIKNIKEVIGAYIDSTTSENYEAEWIVRDFEQIDGGILLAAAQQRDKIKEKDKKVFHFAGVSDENILGKVKKELPWPLTSELFMQFSSKIADICSTSRNEYDNFLRYSLFYGTYFLPENKEITLSYIKKLSDNEAHPYSIISNIMNIKPKDYKDDVDNVVYNGIDNTLNSCVSKDIEIDPQISDSEKRSMETCFWRYLYNHCLDKDTFFFEEWQIEQISKYFMKYSYLNSKGKYTEEKFKPYKNYLPIFDETDYEEIINEIKVKDGQPDKSKYINNRMEFIYRNMNDYEDSNNKVLSEFENELKGDCGEHYNKNLCMNCNQKTFCFEYINNLNEED